MTFPDPRLERLGSSPELPDNTQDVIPPSERSEDPVRAGIEHGLSLAGARPLTEEERKAADRDSPAGERVYAPASERVPVDPVPGHREFVEHPDTHTAEREAAGASSPSAAAGASFTPVQQPSATDTPTPGGYASPMSNPGWDQSHSLADDGSGGSRRRKVFLGVGGTWLVSLSAGAGIWLFLRWRRERNKPINRIRRQARQAAIQARQAASELRERVPSPDEAAKPAVGVSTVLLSILLLLWQQARSREDDSKTARQAASVAERAAAAASDVSDLDWQKRLAKLKQRWNPRRLELEKTSISRRFGRGD